MKKQKEDHHTTENNGNGVSRPVLSTHFRKYKYHRGEHRHPVQIEKNR